MSEEFLMKYIYNNNCFKKAIRYNIQINKMTKNKVFDYFLISFYDNIII